jgi:Holliday junction resolvase
MPNRRYQRGRRTEYEVIAELQKQGYHAFRSAGSKSSFDVIGINSEVIKLIQVKTIKKKKSFKAEIEELKSIKNIPENAWKELWIKKDRKGFEVRVIE